MTETRKLPELLAYRKNIQIAELNAINAGLAVLRYKQVRGFYVDDAALYHLLFRVNDLHIRRPSHYPRRP